MRLSRRLDRLPPYLFLEISRKIGEKKAQGIDVISFGIGDPDIPTPSHIIESLCKASLDLANHRYPETDGLPEFRKAIAEWYEKRFGLSFNPNKEVLPLIGSKEGIGHIALCLIDPGDIALMTDPAYPVYSVGTMFAGGEPYYLPLKEERNFLPDLESVPEVIAQKAKLLWINYPNNPTAATAEIDFFERCVSFARKYDIVVCHDGPYSEVAYDGYKPASFLQAKGAGEVGVEFHSLSKTFNMTGWRVGMMVGNEKMVDALLRVKSNLDSGIPQAIQHAAITALRGNQECIEEHNRIYQKRRDKIMAVLNKIGLKAMPARASLYLWVKIPAGFTSLDFAARLLNETNVVVTPGVGYGKAGEGFIRLSITIPDERMEEGLKRLLSWKGLS